MVVWLGVTLTEPEETLLWLPRPLSMLTVEAPLTDQDRVADWPLVILVGEAVKELMVGLPEEPEEDLKAAIMAAALGKPELLQVGFIDCAED